MNNVSNEQRKHLTLCMAGALVMTLGTGCNDDTAPAEIDARLDVRPALMDAPSPTRDGANDRQLAPPDHTSVEGRSTDQPTAPDAMRPDSGSPDMATFDLSPLDQQPPDLPPVDMATPDLPPPDLPPPTCEDSTQNGLETDIDCGGGTCPECMTNEKCLLGTDCQSGVCSDSQRCSTVACDDEVKNGTETDVDCGGDCPVCEPGATCSDSTDCRLNNCQAGACAYPASCEELLLLDSGTATGEHIIHPPSAPVPLTVHCDMETLGGGWTQLLQCLPDDGCQIQGTALYNVSWVGQDHGEVSTATSYLLGLSLAELVNTDGLFMVQITDTQQDTSARLFYPLDQTSRPFFAPGAAPFKSTALNVTAVDSGGAVLNQQLKICAALGMHPYPRSYQGASGLSLLGQTSGTPDPDPTDACDFGPWDSQILIRPPGVALSTLMWGQVPKNGWSGQPYAHRVYVRGPKAGNVTIIADGNGRRWSDGTFASSCAEYRWPPLTSPRSYAGATGNGVYQIQPDTAGSPLSVHCDMTTDGGGWTLVQRSVWSWTETQVLHTNFDDFYGQTIGAPTSAFRAAGIHWAELIDQGEMLVVYTPRRISDGSSCGPLYYKGTGGALTAEVATKTFTLTGLSASQPLTNNTELSTTDSGPSQGCVNTSLAIPWFYQSCCITCPTYKGGYWADEPHPMVRFSASGVELFGSTLQSACGGDIAVESNGYNGMNAIEILLR